VAFRNVVFPFLGGGAVLLGYAAFSWLRTRRAALTSSGPSTLREAGSPEMPDATTPERDARSAEHDAPVADDEPLSERSPDLPEVLELDLEFEDELPLDHASLHDAVAPEDIGALFLARATDALSPFGDHFERDHFDLDQLNLDGSLLSEATARAANGEQGLEASEEPEPVAESEQRPAKAPRAGGARS
jgi:hypothetical protein